MPSILAPRDPFSEAKNTLSSWDNCMAKSYCKWPVIVGIVVGSLIIFSIVFCIVRCVCCGAEVACCCFKCCSCCCPSGRSNKHKRVKSDPTLPYQPPPYTGGAPAPVDTRPLNQQYRSHAAPVFNPAPQPEEPQFARFESTSKPVNEDALPAMPSWKDAKSTHVEEEVIPEKRGDVELDRLDHNGSVAGSTTAAGVAVAGATRRSPGPGRSPVQRLQTQDAYGFPPGYQNDSFVNNAPPRSDHSSPGPYGRPYGQQDGYRGMSPVQRASPVYGGAAGYAQNQQYDRRSPGPGYNQQYDRNSPGPGYNQQYARNSPGPGYNQQYDQNSAGLGYSQQQYRGPSPPQSRSPAHIDQYGYPSPQPNEPLMSGNGGYRNDNYAPAPARSPSPEYAPVAPARVAQSPAPAYPGQQTYEAAGSGYPGQQSYQAYNPGQPQGEQSNGVARRPVEGSWKEV